MRRLARIAAMAGAALALTVAAGVLAPTMASAAGGGCTTNSQNGWNIGACQSDDGVHVYADLYVNWQGNLGSSCKIRSEVIDYNTNQNWDFIYYSCSVGRHGPGSVPKVAGHSYRNCVDVFLNNQWMVTQWTGCSPFTT
jgi:hypothetical protein